MFDFARLDEIVTDPREFASPINPGKRRQFVEITKDTPLTTLSKFFEWNSAAVVTEKTATPSLCPSLLLLLQRLISLHG
ncbi:cystathionine beta-synthase [Fusarium oxysporum]|nr:cystathionine beta-synthase [Fusarium oxysporum]